MFTEHRHVIRITNREKVKKINQCRHILLFCKMGKKQKTHENKNEIPERRQINNYQQQNEQPTPSNE